MYRALGFDEETINQLVQEAVESESPAEAEEDEE